MDGVDIEIPDSEDAACALDVVEARLVRQGQYDAACDVISAQRRIRADADEIARLESQLAEAETTIGALKHLIGEQTDEIARLRKALVWAVRHGVFLNTEMSDVSPVLGYWPDARFGGEPEMDLFDDSPDEIIATVCRLAEGE